MSYSGSGPGYEQSIVVCLRQGGTWKDVGGYLPPGPGPLGWARKQPKFQRAYTEGTAARMQRHAMAGARCEVEALLAGRPYEYRPFEEER